MMMRNAMWGLVFVAATTANAAPAKPVAKPAARAALKAAVKKPAKSQAKPEAKSVAPLKAPASRIADLVYATPPGFRPLTLDLYEPPHTDKFPKPALVFVHGGAWNSGDARQGGGFKDFPGVLAGFAAKGYVVASVNYRLSGEAHFPAAVQDVKSAIRWLRAHAGEYGIDTTRIAVWGEEAGGQIAALVGTSCGVSALEPVGSPPDNMPSDCVEAVIDWHGVSDLVTLAQGDADLPPAGSTPEGAYLGCEPAQCAPGVARAASPIAYIGPNTPPFLIQHGAHKTVPLAQSQKLSDALRAAHIATDYATYNEGEADVAQRSLDKVADFLALTFPKKQGAAAKTPPRKKTSKALPY